MKAVNLIPSESQRSRGFQVGSLPQGPAAILLGLLAVALALVTVYVLTGNSISDRKATIATDQVQLAAVKAEAAQLSQYSQFAQLAQARIQTIRQIATSRFDWDASLSDLSKVVPANTSLQSLVGTVSSDASVGGASGSVAGASAGSLRSAINSPAFQLSGCTASHDDVARLMSRLRLMDGVIRVTLADSSKATNTQSGGSVGTASQGCGPNAASFDLVVFFKPLPGATSSGAASTATSVATSTTTTATTPGTTPVTTPATTSTTSQTTTTSTTQSVSSTGNPGAAR